MEKNGKKNCLLIFPNIITEQWGFCSEYFYVPLDYHCKSFFFEQNSKELPTVEYRRRRKQTKRLEMPFLKTDISWQLGVIGSVYPPIADIFSLHLD